jgi:hypothetical protein
LSREEQQAIDGDDDSKHTVSQGVSHDGW